MIILDVSHHLFKVHRVTVLLPSVTDRGRRYKEGSPELVVLSIIPSCDRTCVVAHTGTVAACIGTLHHLTINFAFPRCLPPSLLSLHLSTLPFKPYLVHFRRIPVAWFNDISLSLNISKLLLDYQRAYIPGSPVLYTPYTHGTSTSDPARLI